MIQGLPGAGKSEIIKWICRAFQEIFGFKHGVHYVCLASQNTVAALINGYTLHSWGGVPVTQTQKQAWQNTNWNTPQLSPLFEKNQHMRWILIDEGSTASAEVFGIVEDNVRRSIRSTGTWKMRQSTRGEERPFGGCNLLFFVDWWQLPPVLSTDLKSTPFPENPASAMVQKAMSMFWNRGVNSLTGVTELTHSYRQALDPWFSERLRQCRHGDLSWTMYCFLHGLPTFVPGSWMPQPEGAAILLCGNPACESLWKTEWLAMRKELAAVDDMLAVECTVCKDLRAERCRVRENDKNDTRQAEAPFPDAPYIVPCNMPKYFAQQLRALEFAQTAQPPQQLLWIVARDTAMLGDIKNLKGRELAKREAQWLQKHDQATNGIMGLFPTTLNQPVRFTNTVSKELRIFKNTRGVLVNWELHPVDVALLQGEQAQEIILKQTPRKLYVQIPGATWKYSQAMPAGVYPLKPVFRPWNLDKQGSDRNKRFGFQLVPDFSGTAHSYVGYTLKAALADCLAWDVTPTCDQMLRAYCSMSRTCTAQTLLVMQPFAPMLFRQGPLPGPQLMMEFWHGRLAAEGVEAAWKTAEASHSSAKYHLEDIAWPCGICKEELLPSHYGVTTKTDHRSLDQYWERIMVPGEWHICMKCKCTLRGVAKHTAYEYRACHQELPEESFNAERLAIWREYCHYDQILCLQCAPIFETSWWDKKADKAKYTCSVCNKALPRSNYCADGFSTPNAIVFKDCNRAKVVEQKHLADKKINCTGPCGRQQLTHHEFTAQMFLDKNFSNWICKECQFPKCEKCHLPSDDPVPFGPAAKKYQRHWVCEWCLYLSCAGCGSKRTRAKTNKDLHFQMWFCRPCLGKALDDTEEEHPACSSCNVKKSEAQQKPLHAHRAWRCGTCWRKAESENFTDEK